MIVAFAAVLWLFVFVVWAFVPPDERPNDEHVNDRTYAVPHSIAYSPAVIAPVFTFLSFVFSLAERKNERQKKKKYRCE